MENSKEYNLLKEIVTKSANEVLNTTFTINLDNAIGKELVRLKEENDQLKRDLQAQIEHGERLAERLAATQRLLRKARKRGVK